MASSLSSLLLTLTLLSHYSYTAMSHQTSILLSLKRSLHIVGPLLDSWDESSRASPCSWSGVQCDNTTLSVVSLDISNSNISGEISPEIANLTTLQYFSVAGNTLSGELPPELCLLPNLRHLNVSNNQFNGSISSWNFSSLKELDVLDAYNNDFSGPLPVGVVSVPNLRHLDLGGNYFSGEIPAIFGDFQRLEYLSLAGNDLSGRIPPEIGNLASLKQVYLGYYNEFTGGIPPELGRLVELTHLDLSSCGLNGTIPTELGSLKKLDTLFLQTNQLTGTIPPELGNLTQLKALDLSNNALTGGIPPELSGLRELYLLHLFINKFHKEIPGFVGGLPKLEILKLWENNFTGEIPPELGSNGRIREIDLSTNKLTGSIPRRLCVGGKLEILILLDNFLFGSIPGELGRCKSLSRVRLGRNYLSGPIPKGFLFLPELHLVELQNNYLTGTISGEVEKKGSSKITLVNLSNNRLFGSIPTTIGSLKSMQILLLADNQFTGGIPPEIGSLAHVLKIDLSRNNLSGGIPPEIGACTLLTYLDLCRNNLSGEIPAPISELHVLNYLNVSWNELRGRIPGEIGGMKSLTAVDFSHNDFSGRVPETGQFAFFNSSSFAANPNLCGSVFGPCNGTFGDGYGYSSRQHWGIYSGLSGKLKLLIALAFLACSVAFVVATVVVKVRLMAKTASSDWKMTAFRRLDFGSQDVVECLKETNIIGRGGAGVVYRGTMPDGEQVAVKKLLGMSNFKTKESTSSPPYDSGFRAEIQTLGKIRHRNIVRLLAFCSNNQMNLLVYEYMPNGSLGELLHGKRGCYLNWDVRVRIAVEAAKGLCYLHYDCCPPILHRDVKSNNILLDAALEAHVADFGLAKFLRDTGMSECMSAIAGSYGYIAPEYAYTLKVDEKSDVYSFGVVLLELITGRKPVGDFGEEVLDIVQWAKTNTNGRKEEVVKILDRRLTGIPPNEAMQVFFVAMLCVQERSIERPTMREVVQMLAQTKQPSPDFIAR